MKKSLYLLFLLIACQIYASEDKRTQTVTFVYGDSYFSHTCDKQELISKVSDNQQADGKIYVDPEMIYLSREGIFLNHCGNLIPISILASDESGLYLYYLPVYDYDWRCHRGHWNYKDDNICVVCGAEKTNSAPRWKDWRRK